MATLKVQPLQNQPTLAPRVISQPVQPTLAPRVATKPVQPSLAPKVVAKPAQPSLAPQVQPAAPQPQINVDNSPRFVRLGQQVKSVYPGIYDEVPDGELGKTVAEKYAGVYDEFIEPGEKPVQQPGLLQRAGTAVVKGLATPFARTLVSGLNAGEGLVNALQATGNRISGNKAAEERNLAEGFEAVNRKYNLPILGEVGRFGDEEASALSILKDAGIAGIQAGSNVVGGSGAAVAGGSLLKGALGTAIKTGAREGLISGALGGLASGAEEEGATPLGIAKSTLLGSVMGLGTGAALAAVPAAGVGAGKLLRGAAREVKFQISPDAITALTKAVKPSAKNFNFKLDLENAAPVIQETASLTGRSINSLDDLALNIADSKKRFWSTLR